MNNILLFNTYFRKVCDANYLRQINTAICDSFVQWSNNCFRTVFSFNWQNQILIEDEKEEDNEYHFYAAIKMSSFITCGAIDKLSGTSTFEWESFWLSRFLEMFSVKSSFGCSLLLNKQYQLINFLHVEKCRTLHKLCKLFFVIFYAQPNFFCHLKLLSRHFPRTSVTSKYRILIKLPKCAS